MTRTRRVLSRVRVGGAIAVGASLAALASFVDGCGSIPCSETDTCVEADGAAPSVDQSLPDVETDASDADASVASDSAIDARVDATVEDADASESADADANANDTGADADAHVEDADAADVSAPDADASDGCAVRSAQENCTNGIDDNCDGKVDCDDPMCQPAYECVPSWATTGWTAPVVLYDDTVAGGPAPAPASCTAPYAQDVMDGHDTPVGAAAACSCSCGAVQGASCSPPFAVVYVNSGCGGVSFGGSLPNGVCTTVENQQGGLNSGQVVDAGALTSGSCTATPTATQPPAWNPATSAAWAGTGRACAAATPRTYYSGAAGGCDAGFTCIESPPATIPKVCLMAAGHIPTCPTAYPDTHRYFDGGTDTRGCQFDCSCGAPTGLQCSPTVDLYSGAGCTGTAVPVSGCQGLSNFGTNRTVSGRATFNTLTGQCAVDAGTTGSTGGLQANTGEMTVCCVPP